jgi:hypothetical protein
VNCIPAAAVTGVTYEDIAGLPRPKRRELRCGAGVIDSLRFASAAPDPVTPGISLFAALTGIDVFTDPDAEPGTWELREDGEVVGTGVLTRHAGGSAHEHRA